MDTSKKRHFVFTNLFSMMENTSSQPVNGEVLNQANSTNSKRPLQECTARPRSKEVSIGMLTNDGQIAHVPCVGSQLSLNREHERQAGAGMIKFPLRDYANLNVIKVVNNSAIPVPKTPPKSRNVTAEPLTPTSNLKLLTDLASRENIPISYQEEVEIEFQDDDHENMPQGNGSLKCYSRKDKSLGLLTSKFLSQYPEYPSPDFITEISLDKASQDLNVGRRRIYDVVNVLEAVQIVKKCAKNIYAWLGKTNLKLTLARLKKLADEEHLGEQILSLSSPVSHQLNGNGRECSDSISDSSSEQLASESTLLAQIPTTEEYFNSCIRKEKSLGAMSQKFMMLLLISKSQVISLDLAARFLIGDSSAEDKTSTAYKTKMRRLYSITHVLTSLGLIEKVDCVEMRGRKPAYKYMGPSFDDILPAELADFENALLSLQSSPKLPAKRSFTEDESSSASLKRMKLPRAQSETAILNPLRKLNSKSLTRRSSLQEVCVVAEEERRKLLFPLTQCALRNEKEAEKTAAADQGCTSVTKLASKSKTSTAILLTSNGTPLRVISISSSPDGSSMLRLVPSTSANESKVEDNPGQSEIPLVQLPLVLQFKSK